MTNFPVTASVGTDLAGALQNKSKVNETKNNAGIQYLKYFPKKAKWVSGANSTPVDGATVIVNTQSISHGWHLWHDKKPVEQVMVPFTQDLPVEPEPIEYVDKRTGRPATDYAAEARGFQGMMEDENGDSVLVEFSGTSHGVRQAIDTLLNEIRAKSFTDAEFLYPEVELGCAEPYENPYQSGEMLYNPKFNIIGWYNMQGEPEGEKAEALTDQSEANSQDEEEGIGEEAAMAPRRRRRK